jgi:hypothetical protein
MLCRTCRIIKRRHDALEKVVDVDFSRVIFDDFVCNNVKADTPLKGELRTTCLERMVYMPSKLQHYITTVQGVFSAREAPA